MTYPEGFGPPPNAPTESIPVRQAARPLYESKTWMKLLGVISIVSGVLGVISIFGIVFAWLPIWLGVLLWQSGKAVEAAHETGDAARFLESQGKLKTYFLITGIASLIGIILMVIAILFFGTAWLAFVRNGGTLS
ncbi:MAG: DUF5362 domain-containing protein [Acidimicrobiia bacterium]